VLLDSNQRTRKKIIEALTKDSIPTDKDTCGILLQSMKDMDKQIIDKKRVAIENKNSDVAGLVAEVAARIARMHNGVDPLSNAGKGIIPEPDLTLIPEYIPIPGETEIGITSENFDTFMAVHGKKK
jgi:hypothetical protein